MGILSICRSTESGELGFDLLQFSTSQLPLLLAFLLHGLPVLVQESRKLLVELYDLVLDHPQSGLWFLLQPQLVFIATAANLLLNLTLLDPVVLILLQQPPQSPSLKRQLFLLSRHPLNSHTNINDYYTIAEHLYPYWLSYPIRYNSFSSSQ